MDAAVRTRRIRVEADAVHGKQLVAQHVADGAQFTLETQAGAQVEGDGIAAAIGDVLRDQLFSMHRVGFDAYATRPDRSIHDALKGLSVFSETYQASWDQKSPLFRRHQREGQNPDLDNAAGI